MSNHNNQFLSIPTSTPKVRRSTSFGGGRLHFDYSQKTGDLQPVTSSVRLPPTSVAPPSLQRQSTIDLPIRHTPSPVPPASRYSGSQISYEQFNPRSLSTPRDVSFENTTRNVNLATSPRYYERPLAPQMSHPKKDIPLTTSYSLRHSSDPFPADRAYSATTTLPAPYRSSLYPYRLNSDYQAPNQPPDTSPHQPILSTTVSSFQPLPTQTPSALVTASLPPRAGFLRSQELLISQPTRVQPLNSQPTSTILSPPLPKPQSLTSQLELHQQPRSLTIGYSVQQREDIAEAERILAESVKKQEAETRAKMEAQKKKAEEEARLEEMRKAEEEKEARRLAEEEEAREQALVDDDEDVERFMKRLNTQIKESRSSKNLKGALVGRQTNQNPAENAENHTNALKNEEETFEGRDDANQASTKSVADSSEEYTFLQRIRNMRTDRNSNRRKFAEHFYDSDDDDSELNSSNDNNSFLSTVTEEDLLETASLNEMSNEYNASELQTNHLQPCVISYIHDLVDDIFSEIEKTAVTKVTQPARKSVSDDFYVTDEVVQQISENAKQFFTPRSSAEGDSNEATKLECDPLCDK